MYHHNIYVNLEYQGQGEGQMDKFYLYILVFSLEIGQGCLMFTLQIPYYQGYIKYLKTKHSFHGTNISSISKNVKVIITHPEMRRGIIYL